VQSFCDIAVATRKARLRVVIVGMTMFDNINISFWLRNLPLSSTSFKLAGNGVEGSALEVAPR
jgi:hypothetical protein